MLERVNMDLNTFEGNTLEEVYEKASQSLNCSITNLEIDIIQAPSKGFLGFFVKKAIITAKMKTPIDKKTFSKIQSHVASGDTLASRLKALNEEKNQEKMNVPKMVKQVQKEELFDEFYSSQAKETYSEPLIKSNNNELIKNVSKDINNLFSFLCYDINPIQVDIIDEGKTVYIEFSGADCALLIGKEGYRYKALSYILFNWINEKYNMMLRLEVAQFLSNQESAILAYLNPVIETITKEGYFKTKILDGILVHIALSKLREEFPDKYVAVKTTQKGEKYILVNEYRK